jgi:hypothetical protein
LRKIILNILLAFIAVFLVCCAGKSGKLASCPVSETVRGEIAPDSGLEVKMEANAKGNKIHISIINNTPSPLRVSPYYFALIIDNKRPEIRYSPNIAVSEIPVTTLKSGTQVSGIIKFTNLGNLKAQKLVFNSPDYEPIMTTIE